MKSVLIFALLACSAHGQAVLSLNDAVSRALSAHPLLAASTERIAASEGLLSQAGRRPNPRAIFQTENFRAYGTPSFNFAENADTYAYLSQLVETSGKRGRRMDLAGANLRKAQIEKELLERQIASRVKSAYWNAAMAEKIHQLLRENDNTFRQIVEYHEIRVREGAMAEADLLRVRLEAERMALATNSAALEADRARIQLFREMGETQFPQQVTFTENLEPSAEIIDVDVQRALEQRPEVKLARQAVQIARANLGVQQAAAKPDLDFLGGYKRTSGFHTVLGGVQFNLPIRDRNQGNIAAASRELRAAESSLAATEALVRAEIAAAGKDFEIRRNQVLRLLPPLRDHAAESSRIALAAYREGGADLLRLLDSERARIDVQLLYFRSLSDYQQSKVALETALGLVP